MAETEVLITEALHGAILADTFRIPWIPVITNEEILTFKWDDWCASVDLIYKPHRLMALWDLNKNVSWFNQLRQQFKIKMVQQRLSSLVLNTKPCLSNESRLNQNIDRLQGCLHTLKGDLRKEGIGV